MAKPKGADERSKRLQFVKTNRPKCKPKQEWTSSDWGLLPDVKDEWKRELDETNTFLVNFFL